MEIKIIRKVMKKYGDAWEKQNSKLILECFTRNGVYQESPLSKPYKGEKEIKKFWDGIVVKNTKNIKFKLGKCYLSEDKKTGFAEWECKNEFREKNEKEWKKGHMVGIMILKMKGNKISYLNEYWNTKTKL
jgi:ketosteroid isomerase-like protein